VEATDFTKFCFSPKIHSVNHYPKNGAEQRIGSSDSD
jgi:hypothetical protein